MIKHRGSQNSDRYEQKGIQTGSRQADKQTDRKITFAGLERLSAENYVETLEAR